MVFSFGLNVSRISQKRVEPSVEALMNRLSTWTTRKCFWRAYLDSAVSETGLILTSGTLQPHLSMRIGP